MSNHHLFESRFVRDNVSIVDAVVRALQAESAALNDVLDGLPQPEFDRLTNCPQWTLAELVVHTADSIRLGEFPAARAGASPQEAADYYRRPERATDSYRQQNVERAQVQTRDLMTHVSPSDYFATTLRRTLTTLAAADLGHVVEIKGVVVMRPADWLITRVISVAAHGLDVALTLGRRPWTTNEARQVIRPVFVSAIPVLC